MTIRYHALARKEVIAAAEYYAQERRELGAEFLEEMDAAERRITANPLQFEQVRPGIRRCLLDRLPFGICFRVSDAGTVRIIVVKHHGRRPGLGIRRK